VAAVTLTTPRPVRLVVIGLAVLGLGWLLAPRFAPPVYDGVGFPDEPYRFVVRPSDAQTTKTPTTATRLVPVTRGTAGAASLASAEQAPQVAVLIPTGRLQAPAGTRQISMLAKPVRPITAPSGSYLWSNVYDVTATDSRVRLKDGNPPATITLRAASAQRPYPSVEYYTKGTWTAVKTVPVGRDIYQATLPTLGAYAVVGSKPLVVGAKAGTGSTSRTGIIIFVAAVAVVIVLIVLGILRRRRRLLEEPA
jgi:hypothetical protein